MKASVVIPAYNEGENIKKVIQRTKKTGSYEIIVVDDGSNDRTAEIAEKEKVKVIRQGENHGKTAACLKGSEKARKEKIVFIDADLQLRPEEIPRFVEALDRCELAIGVRNMKNIPLQRRLANMVARKMISRSLGQNFSDVLCGFRAVRKKSLKKMHFSGRGYEFEAEMLLEAIKSGMKIEEVPVSVSYESYKGMSITDSIKLLIFILRRRKV